MAWLIPLALLIILEGVADIFSKEWSLRSFPHLAILALTSYLVANVFWLLALKNGSGLGRGSVIFSVASAILGVVVGYVFYGEQITNLEFLGSALGLCALILILWG